MRPFVENIPVLCIFLAMVTGILTTLVPRGRSAMKLSLAMLLTAGVLNGILFFTLTAENRSFAYGLGQWGAPWGNELQAGPAEAALATAFCFVMFLSILGGARDIEADILPRKQNLYFIMLDLLLASLFALCYTNDLFTAYVFIEVNTICACAIVMARDCSQTIVATIRYLIMSLVGSGMFLFALVLTYSVTGHLVMPSVHNEIVKLLDTGMYHEPLTVVAGMICIGLAIKSALFPFHTWLPDAHGSGTTTSSAVLSGVVLKGYVILMVKIFCRVFPLEEIRGMGVANILFVLGVAAMIFGSVRALQENYCKKMIAYSSVAQVGYIYMGLGLGTTAAIAAALFQVLAHAFTKPLLFISAGGLIDASGHQKKLYYLRGAAHRCPVAGIGFTVGGLSMVGIPLLAGFITKGALADSAAGVFSLQSAVALAALAVSGVLNALYYLPAIIQIWKGEQEPTGTHGEVYSHGEFAPGRAYCIAVAGFIAMVILLGCLSAPLLEILRSGVELL